MVTVMTCASKVSMGMDSGTFVMEGVVIVVVVSGESIFSKSVGFEELKTTGLIPKVVLTGDSKMATLVKLYSSVSEGVVRGVVGALSDFSDL